MSQRIDRDKVLERTRELVEEWFDLARARARAEEWFDLARARARAEEWFDLARARARARARPTWPSSPPGMPPSGYCEHPGPCLKCDCLSQCAWGLTRYINTYQATHAAMTVVLLGAQAEVLAALEATAEHRVEAPAEATVLSRIAHRIRGFLRRGQGEL